VKFDIKISAGKRSLVDVDNFKLPENKITFLLGESGIGKSLIARAIYGLLSKDDLIIRINNKDYDNYLRSDLCDNFKQSGFFVFQEPSSHLNPLMKISDQLNEGSIKNERLSQNILQELWPDTELTEINGLTNIYPRPFRPSGGEKQRFLLAMALKKMTLSQDKKGSLLIFDEPTGSLDNVNRNIFFDLLVQRYKKNPVTVLFISHDYSMINRIYQNYTTLLKHISFIELSRNNEKHIVEDFSTKSYLDWHSGLKASGNNIERSAYLTLKSGFQIFNREYSISKDPVGKQTQDMHIYLNDLVYLKAGSGIGKTTLAKILIGLYKAKNLKLRIGKINISEKTSVHEWKKKLWAKKISMIFQHADEALNLNSRVIDVFSGLPKGKKPDKKALLQQLKYFFDESIETSFLKRKIQNLSGGQKQRLNILRTFLLDTNIIILDEPLNGLDFNSMRKIIEILLGKKAEGKGILLISHNEDIFDQLIPEERRYFLHARPVSE